MGVASGSMVREIDDPAVVIIVAGSSLVHGVSPIRGSFKV